MTRAPLQKLLPIALQIALVAASALVLAFYPPRDGAMALIALDGRDAGRIVQPALQSGAELIGRGPLANILLVRGQRDLLSSTFLPAGVILVAAPRSWCSATEPSA